MLASLSLLLSSNGNDRHMTDVVTVVRKDAYVLSDDTNPEDFLRNTERRRCMRLVNVRQCLRSELHFLELKPPDFSSYIIF